MTAFNLFALTEGASSRIVRVPLSGPLQSEITQTFKNQEADFNRRAASEVAFDGTYKPDFNECLSISDFDDIDGALSAIQNPMAIRQVDPDPVAFADIKSLFSGYIQPSGETVALFQAFDRKRVLSSTGFLTMFFSANHFEKMEDVGLTIDNKIAVILQGQTLRFFSFHVARQIFDLSQNYIEATDADLNQFLSMAIVHTDNQSVIFANSDSWVRRKIALIRQSGVLEDVSLETMRKVAEDFGINFMTTTANGKEAIVLPSEKAELKKLLRFLDEDFYKSSLLSRNYMTNSKIRIG